MPNSQKSFRVLLLLGGTLLGACPRAVLFPLPDASQPDPLPPAPDPPRIDSLALWPHRDAWNPDGGPTVTDGGLLWRAFAGDVLEIRGAHWDPAVVRVRVGLVDLALQPGADGGFLAAALPTPLPPGPVVVAMGAERVAQSAAWVTTLGPGHLPAPRTVALADPQFTINGAGTSYAPGYAPEGALEGSVTSLERGLALSFNLGSFTTFTEPGRAYAATLSAFAGSQTVLGVLGSGLDGGRVAMRSVTPMTPWDPYHYVSLAGLEQVLPPGDGGPPLGRVRADDLAGPLEAGLYGRLLRHHVFVDDEPEVDPGAVLAFRALRDAKGHTTGTAVQPYVSHGDALVAVGGVELPGEVTVAAGLLHPDFLWDPAVLDAPEGTRDNAALVLLDCVVQPESGWAEPVVRVGWVPADSGDLARPLVLTRVPLRGWSSCFEAFCLPYVEAAETPALPAMRELQPADVNVLLVVPAPQDAILHPEGEQLCSLLTAPCDPDQDADGGAVCQPVDGPHSYRLDDAWASHVVSATALRPDRGYPPEVVALRSTSTWESSTLQVFTVSPQGTLQSVEEEAYTAAPLRLLCAEPTGVSFFAIPVSGSKVEVVPWDRSPSGWLDVLGRPWDVWPLADPTWHLRFYPATSASMDINGQVHLHEQLGYLGARGSVVELLPTGEPHWMWKTRRTRTADQLARIPLPPVDAGVTLYAWEMADGGVNDDNYHCQYTLPLTVDQEWFLSSGEGVLCGSRRGPDGIPGGVAKLVDGFTDLVAYDPVQHRALGRWLDPEVSDGAVEQLVVADLVTRAVRTFAVYPDSLAVFPSGAAAGVFLNLEQTEAFYGCIPPSGELVRRGEPAFWPRSLVVSADGRRMYAGVEGAILEMAVEDDPDRCPEPQILSQLPVAGTPTRLRMDGRGSRLLWLDGRTGQVGALE